MTKEGRAEEWTDGQIVWLRVLCLNLLLQALLWPASRIDYLEPGRLIAVYDLTELLLMQDEASSQR